MARACSQGRCSALALSLAMAMSLCVWFRTAVAVNYVVGDASGWTIMSYDTWEEGKTFRVGDTLQFVYDGTQHDVVEVTDANYKACAKGSNTVFTNGNTTYNLTSPGDKYFICTVGTHCSQGMKLDVDVEAASSVPAPGTNTTSPTANTTGSPSNASPYSIRPSITAISVILGLTVIIFSVSSRSVPARDSFLNF